jgi:ribonuclease R
MNGTIQIRAGKTLVVDASGVVLRALPGSHDFLVGDTVTLADPVTLVSRKRQVSVGIVKTFSPHGIFLTFPWHPGFQTYVRIAQRVSHGDRVIVVLESTGAVTVIDCFSGDEVDDVPVLLRLYSLVDSAVPFLAGAPGPARYSAPFADLSHLDTFTVDPVTSVDLDDAISIDVERRRLYVHIVDIVHGLTPGLETAMFRHGSTLYLPNDSVHLLPHESVSSMSLNVGVTRHAITVEMTLGETWDISQYAIYPSTIVVKRRLNYEQLDMLKGEPPYTFLAEFAGAHVDKVPLDLPGLVTVDGVPHAVSSNDLSHRMIACAMIATNVTVSAHLVSAGVVIPQRFHEAPRGLFASDVPPVTGDSVVDSYLAAKKWRSAVYDLHRHGHFGLGVENYVHFTSPLRRYADVFIHRLLAGTVYDPTWLETAVDALNDRAKFVRGLHKYAGTLRMAHYLLANPDLLRSVYATAVSRAGVSWYSPQFLINGFTHVSKLGTAGRWELKGDCLEYGTLRIVVGTLCNVRSVKYDFSTGTYDLEFSV